mmetsp:Transcript_19864/g.35426  ORF Transcript_19864/g.35426 Transcript_19864/m.35426 type:complete len:233 (-) Transcript_19864:39-737(-)
MSFGNSNRFSYVVEERAPGPRYDHLTAFQKYDSRIKRTAAYSFTQQKRFITPRRDNTHPGIMYKPNYKKVVSAPRKMVFGTGPRRRKNPQESVPGPKYDPNPDIIKKMYPRSIIGCGNRFPEEKINKNPGPRYKLDSAYAAIESRATGGNFSFGNRGEGCWKANNQSPGPAYIPKYDTTTNVRAPPKATFGTARRFPEAKSKNVPGPRYTPNYGVASTRSDLNVAKLVCGRL